MALKTKTNIRLAEACARYLERIKNEGQSETSQYTARYALARFRKAVATRQEPNPYVHTITREEMDDYCYGPAGIRKDIAAVSFNRYRSVLKVFFDYAILMRWTDVNPMEAIGRARPDAPKTRLLLNAGELMNLLDHCHNPIERIACSLGMNTGMRGNDIRHLTVFDANLAGGVIQTEIRKTRKLDVKPITMELHWELSTWFNTYAELMGLDSISQLEDDWLLMPAYRNPAPREFDQRIHINDPRKVHTNPWRLVQRPLGRMGFPTKGEGFHTLRRSSARALFESLRSAGEGRDHALMVVKEFLNHSSTSQTEHYLGLNHERAIRDVLLKDRPFLSALATAEQSRVDQRREANSG
jgi:integrase